MGKNVVVILLALVICAGCSSDYRPSNSRDESTYGVVVPTQHNHQQIVEAQREVIKIQEKRMKQQEQELLEAQAQQERNNKFKGVASERDVSHFPGY